MANRRYPESYIKRVLRPCKQCGKYPIFVPAINASLIMCKVCSISIDKAYETEILAIQKWNKMNG